MSLRLDSSYFSHGVIYQSMLKKNADSDESKAIKRPPRCNVWALKRTTKWAVARVSAPSNSWTTARHSGEMICSPAKLLHD